MNYEQEVIVRLISHLLFIALSWWALQALHFDKFLRGNKVLQARVLYILITIALGTIVSNFFLDYLQLGNELSNLFE